MIETNKPYEIRDTDGTPLDQPAADAPNLPFPTTSAGAGAPTSNKAGSMTDTPHVTMTVTIPATACARCRTPFTPAGRRIYCSDACRQSAYRQRKPVLDAPRAAIVYECTTCQRRYLDERRCQDCNLYCKRIGPGANCPHCDEPVAHADLN